MHPYYDGDYWKQSREERVRAAQARVEEAQARVAASRGRLTDLPDSETIVLERTDTVPPASSYQYQDPRMRAMARPEPIKPAEVVEVVVGHAAARKHLWNQYLLDFEWYLQAKLEYERLLAELEQTRMRAPEVRPPSDPRNAPPPASPPRVVTPTTQPEKEPARCQEIRRRLGGTVKQLRRAPSAAMMRQALMELAQGQWWGCGENRQTTDAMEAVGDAAVQRADAAKQRFKVHPTSQNCRTWLMRRAESQLFGRDEEITQDPLAGVARLRPPGPYTIQPGDTLSKLAKEFYGQEWLWYVIYERNMGATPDNPDLILPGLTLDIP
jgi:nucleoid-associated protein YgaU